MSFAPVILINFLATLKRCTVLAIPLMCLSAPALAQNVEVYLAYAENERTPVFFPNPWRGSPNTTFLGYPGPAWDTGAILVGNIGTAPVTLNQGASVTGFANGARFQLWDALITAQGITIQPGAQVILAQTAATDASGQFSSNTCTRGSSGAL
jgi:hypothetical protein